MNLTLKVWRQDGPQDKGHLETHQLSGVTGDMSFLEMMDVLNDKIIREGGDPIAFDHDCREGICGMCSMFINGEAHGPGRGVTTCQLHMRSFKDGDTITIEPWRASAFPVVKDLAVDRGAFDRIIQAGGYVSVNTSGETLDANAIPIPKADADEAFKKSRFMRAMLVKSMPLGHSTAHAPVFVQLPNPSLSICSTMRVTRRFRSGCPCGKSAN